MPDDLEEDDPQQCLIVEDSRFDQKLLQRVVERLGLDFEIHVVSTITGAREMLVDGPISLILLDNNLPDGKGANFALELNEDAYLRDIPIIIVSDWPSPFMWQKAQLAGVAAVVNKSEFSPETIIEALPANYRLL